MIGDVTASPVPNVPSMMTGISTSLFEISGTIDDTPVINCSSLLSTGSMSTSLTVVTPLSLGARLSLGLFLGFEVIINPGWKNV